MKFVSVILVLISCLSSDSNFLFHGEPSNPVLGDNYGKETVYKITLDFIVYFDEQYVTIWTSLIPTFKCQISLITR